MLADLSLIESFFIGDETDGSIFFGLFASFIDFMSYRFSILIERILSYLLSRGDMSSKATVGLWTCRGSTGDVISSTVAS